MDCTKSWTATTNKCFRISVADRHGEWSFIVRSTLGSRTDQGGRKCSEASHKRLGSRSRVWVGSSAHIILDICARHAHIFFWNIVTSAAGVIPHRRYGGFTDWQIVPRYYARNRLHSASDVVTGRGTWTFACRKSFF